MRFAPLLVLLLAVAALSGSSSASLTGDGTTSKSSPCPPTSGRLFCVDLTTYNGLARNGGIEVDLQLENWDGSTLTNPKIVLSWAAVGTGVLNLQPASPMPSSCSPSATTITCSFANIAGAGSSAPRLSPSVRLFFTVAADASISAVNFTATGTAKESCNDGCPGGAANLERQEVTASMPFGSDPTTSTSVALGGPLKLNALLSSYNASGSSVQFVVPPGTNPFFAKLAASSGLTTCFGGITCTGLRLDTDLSGSGGTFSVGNQILWISTLNSTTANVDAFHYYDPVAVTASPPKTFTSTKSFAACDGVNFATAPSPLSANTDYFVVNATATSFQVASAANGKALSFTESGDFSASCIRVIGDQKSEKTTSCDPLNPPSQSPALYAAKLTNSTVQVCLWDTGNGHIGY